MRSYQLIFVFLFFSMNLYSQDYSLDNCYKLNRRIAVLTGLKNCNGTSPAKITLNNVTGEGNVAERLQMELNIDMFDGSRIEQSLSSVYTKAEGEKEAYFRGGVITVSKDKNGKVTSSDISVAYEAHYPSCNIYKCENNPTICSTLYREGFFTPSINLELDGDRSFNFGAVHN